jgi:hypothetical protein
VPSSGPFTTTIVAASNLPVGSGVVVILSSQAHLTASAPFRVRARGPVSGRLSGATNGGLAFVSRFPGAFRPPAFASRSSDSRRGIGPSLRSAYRTRDRARTPTGLPRSARTSCDRGGRPLYPEDGGALPGLRDVPSRRLPHHSGPSLHPAATSHRAGLCFTRHQRGFTRFARPVFPSPVAARVERAALGLSLELRTPPLPAAHVEGGDRPSSTDLEQRFTTSAEPPILRVHSLRATSRRTVHSRRQMLSLRDARERAEAIARITGSAGDALVVGAETVYAPTSPGRASGLRTARRPSRNSREGAR